MPNNIKTVLVRFNLDKPKEKEAYEALLSLNHNPYKSFSQVIISSLNEFHMTNGISNKFFFGTEENDSRFFSTLISIIRSSEISSSSPVSNDSLSEEVISDSTVLDSALSFADML